MPKRLFVVLGVVIVVVVIAVIVTQTGGDEEAAADEEVTLEYILWDANQLPAYEEVAEEFMEDNPNIEIDIVQMGWADYWDDLTRRLAVDDAPDVWTNHVAFFRDFAEREQMLALDDRIDDSERIDLDSFMPGLADLFVYDGTTYGLPKDWDTVAVLYNREHLDDAGIDESEFENLTWNPDDGGTMQEMMARLSVDENGNNGLDDDFDPDNVERYGFTMPFDGMSAWGQTQFAHFAASLGWEFHDEDGEEFYYDEPEFVQTIQWMRDMTDAGYMMPFADSEDVNELFVGGEASLTTDGSWMIGFYVDGLGDDVGFARLPEGPEGRNSMFNGLSDAIWAGTDHPEEAWKWVEFMATEEAQNIVAEHGVVFPAIESATEKTLEVREEDGLDVTAFTDLAFEEDQTHLHPIVANATDIDSIMQDAFERIWLEPADPDEELERANSEINALF